MMGKVVTSITLLLTVFTAYKIHQFISKIPERPHLENTWWGSRDASNEDETIKPFKIHIPIAILEDLHERLSTVRPFVPPLEAVQHQYGLNTNLLQEVLQFWRTKYNWTQREEFLNQYPQFTVSVQGLRLHYLHVKPANPKNLRVLPLLMLHGWPESVRSFYDLIPILTIPQDGREFVFELIIPSLPGFGFSEAAARPGLGAMQMAVVFKNFMQRLGFEKYYLQGGDWGAMITQHMAALYPDRVLGIHTNMCFANSLSGIVKLLLGSLYPSFIVPKKHEDKVYPLSSKSLEWLMETGYLHLQATKPDTIGVGLNDSPVGLAAYFLEKYITFTNAALRDTADGGLVDKFGYEKLLDNIMIYWVTNSITTSMRIYAESFNVDQFSLGVQLIPITIPSACARFRHELIYHPTPVLKEKFEDLVQVTDFEDGGHFASLELPRVLAKDIYSAYEKILVANSASTLS